jgi:hypothetical protein
MEICLLKSSITQITSCIPYSLQRKITYIIYVLGNTTIVCLPTTTICLVIFYIGCCIKIPINSNLTVVVYTANTNLFSLNLGIRIIIRYMFISLILYLITHECIPWYLKDCVTPLSLYCLFIYYNVTVIINLLCCVINSKINTMPILWINYVNIRVCFRWLLTFCCHHYSW